MQEQQRQLIRQMLAGDRYANNEFVHLWQPRIFAWSAHRCPKKAVEEYVQEVWWHLLKNDWVILRQWDGLYSDGAWHSCSLESYLKTITVNKVTDMLRRDNRQLSSSGEQFDFIDDDGPLGINPESEAGGSYLWPAFDRCFSVLKARDQRLLVMWREGHQDLDTAIELDTNSNNVQQRRFYLLRKLRECLREKLPGYFRDV